MLEVRDLHVRYGNVTALRGLSMSVADHEIVSIVGPNGAGKSTLLWAISGVVRPAAGDITLNGRSILGLSPEAIAAQGVSLVPEDRHVFGRMTVDENLQLGMARRRDKQRARTDFEEILESFPILRERLHARAGTLSGGEQQQLVIARALMTAPSLLMLDEPSLGLSPRLVRSILGRVTDLRARGVTVLLVEQNAQSAVKLADRSYALRNGEVARSGTAAELLDDADLTATYFGRQD